MCLLFSPGLKHSAYEALGMFPMIEVSLLFMNPLHHT